MRSSVLLSASVAALALATGAASAADLPYRRAAPAPAPYVAVPVFTWTGFYVGANAGGGFSDGQRNNGYFGGNSGESVQLPSGAIAAVTPASGFGYATNNRSRSGFTGGGQAGYNYQIGSIVLGVEGDVQYTDFGNRRGAYSNGGVFQATTTTSSTGRGIANPVAGSAGNIALFNGGSDTGRRSDYYGTVRGRVGYAFDRVLVYATGGVAFFDDGGRNGASGFANGASIPAPFFTTTAAANAGANVTSTYVARRRDNDVGYVVGGGVEYAFTDNVTGRIEGFYVDRNTGGRGAAFNQVIGVSNTGAPITANILNRRDADSFGVVRAGVNYKFTTF